MGGITITSSRVAAGRRVDGRSDETLQARDGCDDCSASFVKLRHSLARGCLVSRTQHASSGDCWHSISKTLLLGKKNPTS